MSKSKNVVWKPVWANKEVSRCPISQNVVWKPVWANKEVNIFKQNNIIRKIVKTKHQHCFITHLISNSQKTTCLTFAYYAANMRFCSTFSYYADTFFLFGPKAPGAHRAHGPRSMGPIGPIFFLNIYLFPFLI